MSFSSADGLLQLPITTTETPSGNGLGEDLPPSRVDSDTSHLARTALLTERSSSNNTSEEHRLSDTRHITILDLTDVSPSRITRLKNWISDHKKAIIFSLLLLIQAGGIYPADRLLRSVLNIEQVTTTSSSTLSSSISFNFPHSIIQESTIVVCLLIVELILESIFLRMVSTEGLAKDLDKVTELREQNPKLDIVEYTKNTPPSFLYRFIIHALWACCVTVFAATRIAKDVEQVNWVVVPGQETDFSQSSSKASMESFTKMSLPETNLRIFVPIGLFALKHLAISVEGIFRMWGNRFSVISSAGTAKMVASMTKERNSHLELLSFSEITYVDHLDEAIQNLDDRAHKKLFTLEDGRRVAFIENEENPKPMIYIENTKS